MKIAAFVLSIIFIIVGVLSSLLALTSFVLFDAPGSENNKIIYALFILTWALPITSFISAMVSIFFLTFRKNSRTALTIFLIPTTVIILYIASFLLLELQCNGVFSC